jgi:hypothetical protein
MVSSDWRDSLVFFVASDDGVDRTGMYCCVEMEFVRENFASRISNDFALMSEQRTRYGCRVVRILITRIINHDEEKNCWAIRCEKGRQVTNQTDSYNVQLARELITSYWGIISLHEVN